MISEFPLLTRVEGLTSIFHTLLDLDPSLWLPVALTIWLCGVLLGYVLAVLQMRVGNHESSKLGTSSTGDGAAIPEEKSSDTSTDDWIVSTRDVAFFQRHLGEGKDGEQGSTHTGGPWELMMKKEIPGLVRYTAWRRSLRNGSTEYKSITLGGGVTAKEFMDFYLDDVYRPQWDTMLNHTQILENIDPVKRKQVTLWRRNFPFNFISEREYVIARCLFRVDKDLYAVTKSVGEDYEHPLLDVDEQRNIVRIDSYYSMWRSRDVSNPWNPDAPACETVLLHHDDLKVPEHLARLTIKLGMWGFVKNIAQQVQPFVQARRERCGMYEDDPAAFGLQPLCLEEPKSPEPSTILVDTSTPASPTAAAAFKRTQRTKNRAAEPAAAEKKATKRHLDGWARGIQRAAWMVVGLTLVRLLMLNANAHPVHHHYSSISRDEAVQRRLDVNGRKSGNGGVGKGGKVAGEDGVSEEDDAGGRNGASSVVPTAGVDVRMPRRNESEMLGRNAGDRTGIGHMSGTMREQLGGGSRDRKGKAEIVSHDLTDLMSW